MVISLSILSNWKKIPGSMRKRIKIMVFDLRSVLSIGYSGIYFFEVPKIQRSCPDTN